MKKFNKKTLYIVALISSGNILCMENTIIKECDLAFNKGIISLAACTAAMHDNHALLKNVKVCDAHIKTLADAEQYISEKHKLYPDNAIIASCFAETRTWFTRVQSWQTDVKNTSTLSIMCQKALHNKEINILNPNDSALHIAVKKHDFKQPTMFEAGMSEWCG